MEKLKQKNQEVFWSLSQSVVPAGSQPKSVLTEKSTHTTRHHIYYFLSGQVALLIIYNIYQKSAFLFLFCKHGASEMCPHMYVYLFTFNSLLLALFGITHGHLIFPFLPQSLPSLIGPGRRSLCEGDTSHMGCILTMMPTVMLQVFALSARMVPGMVVFPIICGRPRM